MNKEWCVVCLDAQTAFRIHDFPVNVGRSEDCEVCIASPYVSRRQFELRQIENEELEFVNKAPVDNLAVVNGEVVRDTKVLLSDFKAVHIVSVGGVKIGVGLDFERVKAKLEAIGNGEGESYFVRIGDKVFGPMSERMFSNYCGSGIVKTNHICWTASRPGGQGTATDFYDFNRQCMRSGVKSQKSIGTRMPRLSNQPRRWRKSVGNTLAKRKGLCCIVAGIVGLAIIGILCSPSRGERLYNRGSFEYEDENYEKAISYFQKSLENGYTKSYRNIGLCYSELAGSCLYGDDSLNMLRDDFQILDKDSYIFNLTNSISWFQKAIESGDIEAYYDLGFCYAHLVERHKGKPPFVNIDQLYVLKNSFSDLTNSISCYERGAEKGHVKAQQALAFAYLNTSDKTFSPLEKATREKLGVHWMRIAAENGALDAQRFLGAAYEHGFYGGADLKEAIKWYRKAAKNGEPKHWDTIRRLEAESRKGPAEAGFERGLNWGYHAKCDGIDGFSVEGIHGTLLVAVMSELNSEVDHYKGTTVHDAWSGDSYSRAVSSLIMRQLELYNYSQQLGEVAILLYPTAKVLDNFLSKRPEWNESEEKKRQWINGFISGFGKVILTARFKQEMSSDGRLVKRLVSDDEQVNEFLKRQSR